MFKRVKNEKGMSLFEMIIVLGIVASLMGYLISNAIKSGDKAKTSEADAQIKTLSGYVKLYKQEKGEYPTSDQGLDALVDAGFMEEIPQDPWKNDYVYENPGSHGHKFEIYSEGPDEDNEADNINSWKEKEE